MSEPTDKTEREIWLRAWTIKAAWLERVRFGLRDTRRIRKDWAAECDEAADFAVELWRARMKPGKAKGK
jgi:hypothetical protein